MNSSDQLNQAEARRLSEITRKRYNRIAPVYNLMEWFVERATFKPWRKLLWSRIEDGSILEIGVGTGKNIPFYPSSSYMTAVDLSDGMMSHAKRQAEDLAKPVNFHQMDVQSLTFPDNSFDTAMATFVFCSVPQPVVGLEELKRVVKPGGDIWLLEHVRVNKPVIGLLMDILNPIIVRIMGANINRQTVKNVEAAGLNVLEVENLKGDLVRLIHASPD
jgi:ubiquinone/menaquinone biosynthesis C-methylase UbiE